MPTKKEWEFLAACSPYQTAIAVQQFLWEGKSMEATDGLDVLIEVMGKSEKRALKSQLIRLMSHIIKWKSQPERRSSSWSITIRSARREIQDIQEEVPSLNRDYLESIWEQCFGEALKDAEDEIGMYSELTSLSWTEVIDEEYSLIRGS